MTKIALSILIIAGLLGCQEQISSRQASSSELIPVDQVYPLLDAANSRWFFFASASRPFGMVNLSPDTQNEGAWGSGYKYNTDTIKGFSHIHAWQISGISVLPVTEVEVNVLDDYFSPFSHQEETVEVGYHKIFLDRYQIQAELTSTTRVGFHRYSFPRDKEKGVVFKLGGTLGPSKISNGQLRKVDNYTLEGQMTNSPTKRRPKGLLVHFQVKFDQAIQEIKGGDSENKIVIFDKSIEDLKMKVAISYTSAENAALNMSTELDHWDFEEIVAESKEEWNEMLGRIEITDPNQKQVRRFYTDLWHALQGRRIISDVDGSYPDNTGSRFKVGQLPIDKNGRPLFRHYNSDSFWGAQWTLNTLWGLVFPDIYSEFVNSLLIYHRDGGTIPRGPSGGNYTYVMTGSSATPFLVSAYQKGIRNYNVEALYEGLKKNHMPEGIMSRAGYEHRTNLGGGIEHYMKSGYVPYPIPEGTFGYHQDGASLTLEYAYQDWTLAQLAKDLGKNNDYEYFYKRSFNYKNVFDASSGWMRPKNIEGEWKEPFDPYQYENGFNESNGVQSTWFVGHDISGLSEIMGGKVIAANKLNAQFEKAAAMNFTPGNSHERGEDPTRARISINYGNQPSIQTAFIFNHLDRPDLTQYWSSEVARKTFGGLSPETGYSGDEDQGLMGSLAVLLKLGIFQMNGGTESNPKYDFGSPLFESATIRLQTGRSLEFRRDGEGVYIDKVLFNGTEIQNLYLRHEDLSSGGLVLFKMRETPK